MQTRHSGSVLFTVLIVVLAITLLGTALIVGAGRHLSSARIREKNVGLENCAQAVRQYVAANVVGGVGMSNLVYNVPSSGATITIKGGHYALHDGGTPLAGGAAFGQKGGSSVQNIANAMPMAIGTGSTQQTGSAVCDIQVDPSDPSSLRSYEVEFSYVGQ